MLMAVCNELDLLSSKRKSMQRFARMHVWSRMSENVNMYCFAMRRSSGVLLGKCSVKPQPKQLISIFAVAKTASPVAFPQDWQRHEFLEVVSVGSPMVQVCI
jgi:hypothetical protein